MSLYRAKKIISNTKDLYISKKEEEISGLADTLDKKGKYLLGLLNSLGDFRKIKDKILRSSKKFLAWIIGLILLLVKCSGNSSTIYIIF